MIPKPHHSLGFTLLEALIVAAIIGILIATTIPSIRSVRLRADEAVTLSRLRQHTLTLPMYHSDHAGSYPWMGDPAKPERALYPLGSGLWVNLGYWGSYTGWNLALADGYYEGDRDSEVFQTAGKPRSYYSSLWYSATFRADPAFWKYETRTGPQQFRIVKDTEVKYPSLKGAFLSIPKERHLSRQHELVGFVDGSSRAIPWDDIMPFYFNGTGRWPGSDRSGGHPVIHTMEGVKGRDVR